MDPMFTNRSGKALICAPLLAAIAIALPVWYLLAMLASRPLSPSWVVEQPLTLLMLVLLYPLLEEIVFRGLVQGTLLRFVAMQRAVTGITIANVAASLLFAGAHLISHTALMATLVFLPSLLFGYFRDRYDGWLTPSILLHCYYNLGYFLIFRPLP